MSCDACASVIDRTDLPHCKRTCCACGRVMYVHEPGEHGIGIRVEKGDQVVLPAGWLKLSFDPTRASGRLTESGLAWFARLIFMEEFPREHPAIVTELERVLATCDAQLKEGELLRGYDLDNPKQLEDAYQLLQKNQESAAWWAFSAASFGAVARDAIDAGDTLRAVWAAVGAERCRSMLVFKQHLEQVVWMGHSAGRVVDALKTWDAQRRNASEEFWQRMLSERSFVLSQVFAAPVVLLGDKAYVGGMKLDRQDAHYVDYLLAAESSRQAILVEIKTPATRLLGTEYRGIWKPSSELSGAVVQAQNYKAEFMQNLSTLFRNKAQQVEAVEPRVVLLVGDAQTELDTPEKRRSFELFRTGLHVPEIVTYDELFKKVEILANIFSLSRKPNEHTNSAANGTGA